LWSDASIAPTDFVSIDLRSGGIRDGLKSALHSLSGSDSDELTRLIGTLLDRRAKIVAWSILYSESEPTATGE